MLNFLKTRVLQRDFESGIVPENPTVDGLKELYRQTAVDEIVIESEWAEALEMVITWRDARAASAGDTLEGVLGHIFSKFKRLPPVERVRDLFGAERAEQYKRALEEAESEPTVMALMPTDRSPYPWKKIDMDAAVTLVVDILTATSDSQEMSQLYEDFLGELKARRRERSNMCATASAKERKQVARDLGIWFPLSKDVELWRKDPRTAPKMQEFEKLMGLVTSRMRLVRSYLQYIPKRRLSVMACKDLDANMARMKIYLQGFARRAKDYQRKTKK
jgi:hypothetical protein